MATGCDPQGAPALGESALRESVLRVAPDPPRTIFELRSGLVAEGAPVVFSNVRVMTSPRSEFTRSGVTFIVQDGTGPASGIRVYAPAAPAQVLPIGTMLDLEGVFTRRLDVEEIVVATPDAWTSVGWQIEYAPVLLDGPASTDPAVLDAYRSMLVAFEDAMIDDPGLGSRTFTLEGGLHVDASHLPDRASAPGARLSSLIGILERIDDQDILVPRMESDIRDDDGALEPRLIRIEDLHDPGSSPVPDRTQVRLDALVVTAARPGQAFGQEPGATEHGGISLRMDPSIRVSAGERVVLEGYAQAVEGCATLFVSDAPRVEDELVALPPAIPVDLPASESTWDRLEGMRVSVSASLEEGLDGELELGALGVDTSWTDETRLRDAIGQTIGATVIPWASHDGVRLALLSWDVAPEAD